MEGLYKQVIIAQIVNFRSCCWMWMKQRVKQTQREDRWGDKAGYKRSNDSRDTRAEVTSGIWEEE